MFIRSTFSNKLDRSQMSCLHPLIFEIWEETSQTWKIVWEYAEQVIRNTGLHLQVQITHCFSFE